MWLRQAQAGTNPGEEDSPRRLLCAGDGIDITVVTFSIGVSVFVSFLSNSTYVVSRPQRQAVHPKTYRVEILNVIP